METAKRNCQWHNKKQRALRCAGQPARFHRETVLEVAGSAFFSYPGDLGPIPAIQLLHLRKSTAVLGKVTCYSSTDP